MKRFFLPMGLFGLLVLLLGYGIFNAPRNGTKEIISPLLGKLAPAFTLPKLLEPGQQLNDGVLRGGWHLVNVWGTWCHECRAEHDALLQIKSEGKVAIVGIDWQDDDDRAKAWLAQLGDPYEAVASDRDGRAAIDWGVYGAPESFLVDPQGIIVEKHIGAMSIEAWQRKFLTHLSRPTSPQRPAGV